MLKLINVSFDSCPQFTFISSTISDHLWYATTERNCPTTRSFREISPQRALFPLRSDSPSKGKPGREGE